MVAMKNVYEVLRSKELELARLRTEVDALRFVAPLLGDRVADPSEAHQPEVAWTPAPQKNKWPTKMGHPYLES